MKGGGGGAERREREREGERKEERGLRNVFVAAIWQFSDLIDSQYYNIIIFTFSQEIYPLQAFLSKV